VGQAQRIAGTNPVASEAANVVFPEPVTPINKGRCISSVGGRVSIRHQHGRKRLPKAFALGEVQWRELANAKLLLEAGDGISWICRN
jgi:hypothetical protein